MNISLIIFITALTIFLWYAFVIIYHFIRFGIGTKPKIMSLVFFIGSFLLFTLTMIAYSRINWPEVGKQIGLLIKI